jgi:hypothetical protein
MRQLMMDATEGWFVRLRHTALEEKHHGWDHSIVVSSSSRLELMLSSCLDPATTPTTRLFPQTLPQQGSSRFTDTDDTSYGTL